MATRPLTQLRRNHVQLLRQPFVGVVSTLREDGSPHMTPVWVDTDGEHVLFNTAIGRAKERHLRDDPRAGLVVVDPEDPYRWVSISGQAELIDEGADEHIDRLAKKYTGADRYQNRAPGEERVIVQITPEHIDSRGV